MRIAKKTSGITSLLIAGIFLVSCSSNQTIEAVKPISAVLTSATKTVTPKEEAFDTHLNDLIRQLGDYDIKKQESAYQEILDFINRFIKEIEKNQDYKSPELDYLRHALKDASETGQVVDVARQSRALRLYALIKPKIRVHPDILKLYPDILEKLEVNEEGRTEIMEWLEIQNKDIQMKSIPLYRALLKSSRDYIRYRLLEALLELGGIKELSPVLKELKDKDENIRLEAIQLVEELGDASVLKDVLPLLKDNNQQIRISAINYLVRIGDKSIIDDLRPLTKDDDALVRLGALSALEQLGYPYLMEDVLPLFNDADSHIRAWAINIIWNKDDKSIIPDILPLAKYSDPLVRMKLATWLVGMSYQKNEMALLPEENFVSLLADGNQDIREGAIRIIRNSGDKSYIKDLLPLIDDTDVDIRSDAIYTLGILGDISLKETILAKMKDNDPLVRLITIRALIKLGGPAMVKEHDILNTLLNMLKNERTVELTIYTLEELGDKTVIKDLLPLMKDKEPRIVLETARALIKLGGPLIIKERGLLGDILPILKDDRDINEYRRGEAAQIISRLGDSSLVKDLLPLLNDKSDYARSQVIQALGELGDKSVIKELLPLVSEGNSPEARLESALMILKLGGPLAIKEYSVAKSLLSCLHNVSEDVQADTLTTLGRLGDNSIVKELLPLLQHNNEKVKWSAAWALTQLNDIR
ncbi:MAG: HEAT repeat domain-containing protein, partial [Planctomycetota bacterium]